MFTDGPVILIVLRRGLADEDGVLGEKTISSMEKSISIYVFLLWLGILHSR